jgi:predicted ATP-grasp superfamily ATP-dependent carboligase
MGTRARQERALRLLEEAAKQLVRAAAELQARGVDTASLSRPVVMVGDAIKELAESLAASESETASTRSAPRPADGQLAS